MEQQAWSSMYPSSGSSTGTDYPDSLPDSPPSPTDIARPLLTPRMRVFHYGTRGPPEDLESAPDSAEYGKKKKKPRRGRHNPCLSIVVPPRPSVLPRVEAGDGKPDLQSRSPSDVGSEGYYSAPSGRPHRPRSPESAGWNTDDYVWVHGAPSVGNYPYPVVNRGGHENWFDRAIQRATDVLLAVLMIIVALYLAMLVRFWMHK